MSYRRCRGSAIAETGPAIFLLIVVIFFPMLDIVEMGAGYIMAGIYHDYMIREIAVSAPPGATPDPNIQTKDQAIAKINDQFQNSSFYKFLKIPDGGLSVDTVTYKPDDKNPSTVQVQTTCKVQPFISIPWFGELPGLNAPYPFIIGSERPQEEKGRN